MIRNSLHIAWRSLSDKPFFTFLNLVGVVLGLLVIYISFAYLRFEKSYDRFHANSEELYRVGRTMRQQDYAVIGFSSWSGTAGPEQQRQLKGIAEVPGIARATQFRIADTPEFLIFNNLQLEQDGILTTNAAEGFIELFSWKLLAGSFQTFKNSRNTLLINASTAYKLLGSKDYDRLINEPVSLGGEAFSIAAVIADVPQNSHFDFQVAAHRERIDYWGSYMYVQLNSEADVAAVESRLNKAVLKIDPSLATNETYKKHFLQKVTDIHLNSHVLYEHKPPGNTAYLYLIGTFGVLILLITLFNYTNLTLALKTRESKVIGVRKVLGASNLQIALQFFAEALVLVLCALPLVFILLYLAIPEFNTFMQVDLVRNPLREPEMLGMLLVFALIMGILASTPPALLLSSKKTLNLFKEKLGEKQLGFFSVRRYLIISQFAILIGVSSVSYFMYKQVQFIETKDLGFTREGLLYTFTDPGNLDVFQQKLEAMPEIRRVGNGSSFGTETFNNLLYKLEGEETVYEDAHQFYLDYDAVLAYNLKTTLAPEIFQNSENHYLRHLINRSAAERFAKLKGIAVDDLIGTQIITEPEYQTEDGSYGIPFTIAGIYEDIHAFSLRERLAPYFITLSDQVRMGGMSIVAYEDSKTQNTIAKIRQVYEELGSSFPLEIEFLDDNFNQLHARDTQTATLVFILNSFALVLAALGIIGITLLLIVSKTKEIGIRKVLGASVAHILKLSVREYVFFVATGFAVSLPFSWAVTQNWLNNFAYRIEIQLWIFPLIALAVFGLAATIVSAVSFKSAWNNPIKSLRTE